MRTFRIGGVHPPENKISAAQPIAVFPLPASVTVPLGQHIGAPAVAIVAKGDKVLAGQPIAKAGGFVSAAIHSPVSGTVTVVDAVPDAGGVRRPVITIAVEGDEWVSGVDRTDAIVAECNLEAKEIIEKIAAAGIVGMGGATFPTQVKLSVPPGKKAEALIINGVECEPYLTSDHRVMLERGDEVVIGAKILARALGVSRIYIGIENNKPDAIAHLTAVAAKHGGVHVTPLKVQYPQGGEKQLIDAVLRRQVPSGALPIDVGAVVQNVGTALAVYEAVQKNKPLVERVVTVTGKGVPRPANLLVRIGTPVGALIEHCGGIPAGTGKIISGGPMMGRAMVNPDSPVTKGTSGILLMDNREAQRAPAGDCIKCAKCVSACPMGLEPYLLSKMSKKLMWADMEPHRVTDCIECGCCAYTCPARLPLLDYVRLGKTEVMKIMRARAQK
ncbi:MAG: electron transport complex subunit RsxC [Rikenellaceae bacterium]|jgi:electron transport complex protein RnfC|nr:electron transport complex subunit RsxC [Rikenellaceae bacterium]